MPGAAQDARDELVLKNKKKVKKKQKKNPNFFQCLIMFIQSQGLDPTQTSREKTGENSSISTTPWNKVTSS